MIEELSIQDKIAELFEVGWNKKKYNKVWISNNVSTFISQTIDTLFFVLLSFIGIMNTTDIIQMIITMLLFKWGIALLDTPFMLLTTKIKNNELN